MSGQRNGDGLHRAKLWQIAGFAFNNTATNMYMYFVGFISYFMIGALGVGAVLATSFVTVMRIWDGVSDPFVGYLVDKTNGRFGKNRPFMLIGNLILMISTFIMFYVSQNMPSAIKLVFFVIIYMIYVVGYTFQCVVTKSAQSCLTNDPKQRPLFTIFDGIYNTLIFALLPMYFTGYLLKKHGDFTLKYYEDAWMLIAPISFILTCIAIFSISAKDRPEYFGTGKAVKVGFKDYWEVLKGNRAIQMLVVSAGTDKLALSTQGNATVSVIVYAIMCGNPALQGAVAAYTSIPTMLFLMFGAGVIASRLGQKKAMMFGTYGSLICCVLSVALFYMADPSTLSLPGIEGFSGFNFFTIAFLVLWLGFKGFSGISGNIVIPMTADCADYEVARSGKYVPGLMGTLFSFVDKMISSLASTIVGIMCAAIGFKDALPGPNTPLTPELKAVGVFCLYGIVIVGLICNVIAMHFYPLTKEKMEEIQDEIIRIKAKGAA
ncbi:MAG: glucuronide permease [Eubacterium sp.]|nr:glucuronide permease [Eubacterium sp.]MCI8918577.1 glucuronide permease [Eubacterium sp.]